ncbi:hypothetical protein CPC08DRAFT_709673 [Agrocybe pediades]|nr:hypothetical protein CPC08DRAFT_709673 [Agrocybe pediades]
MDRKELLLLLLLLLFFKPHGASCFVPTFLRFACHCGLPTNDLICCAILFLAERISRVEGSSMFMFRAVISKTLHFIRRDDGSHMSYLCYRRAL